MSSIKRYDIRKNDHDEWWTIYDIFTGEAARYEGTWLITCNEQDARDLGQIMNAQYVSSRERDTG